MGAPVVIIPGDFWISKPHLRINPTQSELGTGYASLALFAVYFLAFGALTILEFVRADDSKRSKSHSLPFLLSVVGFCALRVAQIAVALGVSNLYRNMATEMVLYCLGCILFLLAFTFIAMTWTAVLRKSEIAPKFMKYFKSGLLIMWALVALGLLCVMFWFEAELPRNFGLSAHDDILFLNNGLLIIAVGPVNNTLVKPQTGIIMARFGVHHSFMAERGLYACYGFVLGFAFAVLGVVLAVSVVRTQGAARQTNQNTIRNTVIRILIIALPVALCFAVIFVFTVLEIATHRHAQRYEYYITSYLATECVALGIMLFHFLSAGLKSVSRTKTSGITGTGTGSGSKHISKDAGISLDGGASGTSSTSAITTRVGVSTAQAGSSIDSEWEQETLVL